MRQALRRLTHSRWDLNPPILLARISGRGVRIATMSDNNQDYGPIKDDPFAHGSIPMALGTPTIVRIPIPGTKGLAIEFKARGWTPKGGPTSTIFFQDTKGKRHLRLDHGPNKSHGGHDYHWNQRGTKSIFQIDNHQPAGSGAAAFHKGAKYYRNAGRLLVIWGATADVVSIVQASSPMQRASEVVSAWALARTGCKVVGGVAGRIGLSGGPRVAAVSGVVGCVVGGIGGYYQGTKVGGQVYNWSKGTFFNKIPEVSVDK